MDSENDSSRVLGTPDTGFTGVGQNEPSSSHNEPPQCRARRGRSGTRMMDVSLSRNSGTKLEIQKFKTFLANTYIFAEEKPDHKPWHKYKFIDEEIWQQFVQLRTTPEALKRREKYQEIGRKNDCPHRASRGGYEKAEKDLMAAKRKRLEDEDESNPSTVVDQPPSPIRCEELWLYIRQKPGGTYTSEQTRVVAERIEDLKKKEAEGSFASDERNDVLTAATGKPDHSGRVRGIGGRVGLKQYFGKSKRHRQSMVTREEMDQTLTAREATLRVMFQAEMSKMKEEMDQKMKCLLSSLPETSVPLTPSAAHMQQSTRGSCIVRQSEQPCHLYVEDRDGHRQLVAKGTVHNLGSIVHHQQMDDDEVRVSVEEGTFISWPVKLVDVSTPRQAPSPPQAPPPHQSSPPPQVPSPTANLTAKEKISDLVAKKWFKDKSWPINEVVGLPHPESVYLENADVESMLLPGQQVTSGIVQMFMKCMHEKLVQQGRIDDFGFLFPVYASTTPLDLRQEYISKRLCEVPRKPPLAVGRHEHGGAHNYLLMLHSQRCRAYVEAYCHQRFACAKPFSDDEVEHIRDVFCEYLYKQVLEKLSQDNN
ncbi:hypothetical protein K1719_018349 [Acacia pycnantha]|nr:hypothetical protein K1719_018349 [Acacia pycnantha]